MQFEETWESLRRARSQRTPISIRNIFPIRLPSHPLKAVSELETRGFVPKAGYDPWPADIPVDWNADPFQDVHWRFSLNSLTIVRPYIAAYAKTNDPLYLQRARDYLVDWSRYNIVDEKVNDFAWYNMCVGQRASCLAFVLDHSLEEDVPMEIRNILIQSAHRHMKELMKPEAISNGNHGLFQMHGLMALAHVFFGTDRADQAKSFAAGHMERLVLMQFSDEGLHLEHSSEYHFFTERVVSNIYDTGWYPNNDFWTRLKERISEEGKWLFRPDGNLVPIGDTVGVGPECPPPTGEVCHFNRSPWPRGMVRHFPVTGYSIVRSSADSPEKQRFMCFMVGGHHSSVHKHSDDLSIEWFDRGVPILVDTGANGYKRGEDRNYVLSTRAHNTVEANGKTTPRGEIHSYGSCLHPPSIHSWGVAFGGVITHASLGYTHKRRLLYAPGRFLIASDELFAEEPMEYVQWWHFHPSLAVTTQGTEGDAMGEAVSVRIRSLGSGNLFAVKGQKDPMQGWVSSGFQKLRPAYALAVPAKGRRAVITTLMSLDDHDLANNLAKRVHLEAKHLTAL